MEPEEGDRLAVPALDFSDFNFFAICGLLKCIYCWSSEKFLENESVLDRLCSAAAGSFAGQGHRRESREGASRMLSIPPFTLQLPNAQRQCSDKTLSHSISPFFYFSPPKTSSKSILTPTTHTITFHPTLGGRERHLRFSPNSRPLPSSSATYSLEPLRSIAFTVSRFYKQRNLWGTKKTLSPQHASALVEKQIPNS
jgi:hypothetical protein